MIGCVLVPYFAAAVERRDDPSLAMVPLVMGETPEDSRTVWTVSGEAAQAGVKPGMTLRQARIICPQARIVPAGRDRYQRVFDAFLEVLTGFAAGVEPGGPHPAAMGYLDLSVSPGRASGADRPALATPCGPGDGLTARPGGQLRRTEAVEMAQCIGRTVRQEVNLAPAIGLAGGKFPAYVAAASIDPNKALVVAPGREAAFLAPFPVDLLPLDGETSRRLKLLGIQSLGQLAALPISAVMNQFGMQGPSLRRLAQGRDDRPLLPRLTGGMERVSRQFEAPIADRTVLEMIVQAVAGELADRLRARGLVGRELRLALYLDDHATREQRLTLRQPTGDPRRLARILDELMLRARVKRGVTGLEASLNDLIPATGQQLDLFVHQTGQAHRLHEALTHLVARYGVDSFYQVSLSDTALPLLEERFRLQPVDAP